MKKLLLQIGMIKAFDVDKHSLVSIDSRNLIVGQIFFALPGENTHGNEFIMSAAAKGAAAAVVSKAVKNCPIRQIVVDDPMQALIDYAKDWRSILNPCCFAITGSNGKTTVRAMSQHVLENLKYKTCSSDGNYNNDLGVALSILKLRDAHTHAVFELGARGPSQIKRLSGLVKPNVGILTNASACHLDGFGSLDNVVKAKSELFSVMESGVAVINADSYGSRYFIAESEHLDLVTYGSDPSTVDFGFSDIVTLPNNQQRFTLHHYGLETLVSLSVPGLHNVYNAVAVIAALVKNGINLNDVVHAISSFNGVARRLMMHATAYGMFVIDDSYNASPASFDCALACLSKHVSKNKWLICGDMAELGGLSDELHVKLMQNIKNYGINNIVLYGPKMHKAGQELGMKQAHYINCMDELKKFVSQQSKPGDALLIKGSRTMQLDQLVDSLISGQVE